MTNSSKLQGTHKWHVGHRSPEGSRAGQLPTPLFLDTGFLDAPHTHGRGDRAVSASCLTASLHGQPQCSGFGPRFWCRFSSCRHLAAHLLGDFQEGLSRGPWTSWACIIQTASPPFRTQSSLASVLMSENMWNKGKVHRRENIRPLCWTLGYVSGVWGTVI